MEKARKTELTREVPQTAATIASMKSDRMLEVEREIRQYEDTLAAARQRFKDTYPDVKNLKNRLELAQQKKVDLQKEEAEAKTPRRQRPRHRPINRAVANASAGRGRKHTTFAIRYPIEDRGSRGPGHAD